MKTATIQTSQSRPLAATIGRALIALVQATVFLVGIPAALVKFVGWPLPTRWPSIPEVRLAIELRDFSLVARYLPP